MIMTQVKPLLLFLLICLAVLTGLEGEAVSGLIEFEGVAPAGSSVGLVTPYTEGGFTLTHALAGNIPEGIFSSTAPNVNSNGTDVFGWCSFCDMITLILTQDSGDPFSIQSLDATNLTSGVFDSGMALDVVGNVSGGGRVNQAFNLVQDSWMTFNFNAGFANLTSLEIKGIPYPANGNFAIDNLALNNAVVPEPSTILFVGSGLIGLIGLRRKFRI